ncbi:MAG: S8 family serine peptidase [Bacteroidota bacterium]
MKQYFAPIISLITIVLSAQHQERTDWPLKDLSLDSVPGISLERAYSELIPKMEKQEVIVALIDSSVEDSHPDLQGALFVNKDEIPYNGKDDDNNGYIDDINGWNFLGYGQDKIVLNGVYSHILALQQQKDWLAKKPGIRPVPEETLQLAKIIKEEKHKESLKRLDRGQQMLESYTWLHTNHPNAFPSGLKYKDRVLDSIADKDDQAKSHIRKLGNLSIGPEGFRRVTESAHMEVRKLSVFNNVENRIWDKVDSLSHLRETPGRGTPYVSQGTYELTHGTQMAVAIAAVRGNGIGLKGFGNHIKMMPLVITNQAGFRDKDFFNAVEYAVDNGAKVVNFSFGEEFSEDPQAFVEAMVYMKKHDVLFVCASGNHRLDLDSSEKSYYPKKSQFSRELLENFIKVGASTEYLGNKVVSPYGNYGQNEVDILAPGLFVASGYSREYYLPYTSGTSYSCAFVSGIAALLRSLFPELTAKETKDIILESGISFDVDVTMPDGTKKHFSEFTASGKIVNAYNAISLAMERIGIK